MGSRDLSTVTLIPSADADGSDPRAAALPQKSGVPLIQIGLQPDHNGIGKSQNRFNGLLFFGPQGNSVV
jgi:hypothetical protein